MLPPTSPVPGAGILAEAHALAMSGSAESLSRGILAPGVVTSLTYGWAWLLKLAEELHGWSDEDGKRWSQNLQPLADALAAKYVSFTI